MNILIFRSKSDESRFRSKSFRQILPLIGPALLLIGLIFGGGLLLSLLQVSTNEGSVFALDLSHMLTIMHDPECLTALWLSLYIAGVSTIIAAILSLFLSLATMCWAHQSRLFFLLLQIPLAVPHLAAAIAFLFLMTPSGLLSRILFNFGLIDSQSTFPLVVNDPFAITILLVYTWKEVPFISLVLLAVLKHTGTELSEAAATLRANRWQRFRHVLLPIISPALGGACSIVFAYTLGAYEVPFLLGQSYPRPLPVVAYRYFSDIDLTSRPEGIALSLFITLLAILAVVLCNRLLKSFAATDA